MKFKSGFSSTLIFACLLLFSFTVTAQEMQAPVISLSPERGFWIESQDGFMGLKLGFRLQQQLIIETPYSEDESIQTNFFIRRGRLLFKGYVFDKKLNYFIQLGVDRGQITLLNAEYRWKPNSTTQVSFGQLFPTTGRQFQTSSKNLQLADRSDVTRFFFTDWDLGISARKSFLVNDHLAFKVGISITHGEGKNMATAPGGWAYASRFEVLPFGLFNANGDYSESDLYHEPTPKLSIGAAYYFNQDAYTKYGNTEWKGLNDNINEYYLDAIFKYNGFSFLGEFIHRTVENELLVTPFNTLLFSEKVSGKGLYIQGGKFISENLEPVFRISFLNPDDRAQTSRNKFIEQQKFVLGLNYFMLLHNLKFQYQLGYIQQKFMDQGSKSYLESLAQFTISF
ncbi:MAG: hypothetical protein JJ971_05525 [Balneolaceae bacterium]|nr:hypothetical protein [Balneolaceae bacterium]MBO6545837.1 hypothetical protein [Balneolaceae bacterium]MBO6647233.1 hypothetical protein [Balneolaceae bacterium]